MPDESVKEVKELIEKVGKSWEAYKETNDQRLKEIESSGKKYASAETEEKLKKIEADLGEVAAAKERLDKLETAFKRRKQSGTPSTIELTEEQMEQKAAMLKYVRKGEQKLSEVEMKALSVGSDPDGGYTVTPDTSGRIVQRIFDTSPMRAVANVVTISTDSLEGVVDDDEAGAGWTSETGSTSDSDTPELRKWRIPVHEMYAKPKATQKLLEDSAVDIEAWLINKLQRRFARLENAAFVSGNGVGKPMGFLSYSAAATQGTYEYGKVHTDTSGTNDALTFDDIITTFYVLKNEYRMNGTWAMNRNTQGYIRKLKDTQDRYLWEPGLQVGQPATILGRPVIEFNDMADVADASISVAFADWMEFYQIVDRVGFALLRDPYSSKPYVEFYTRRRVGGAVVNFDAGVLLKTQ